MNKNKANEILARVSEILEAEFPEFEQTMSVRRYSESGTVSFKMEFVDRDAASEVNEVAFQNGCFKNNVNPSCRGLKFTQSGKNFVVVDVKNRKQKYPVIAECREDGQRYKFTAMQINRKMIEFS